MFYRKPFSLKIVACTYHPVRRRRGGGYVDGTLAVMSLKHRLFINKYQLIFVNRLVIYIFFFHRNTLAWASGPGDVLFIDPPDSYRFPVTLGVPHETRFLE